MRQCRLSCGAALDRFWLPAQHHSYTNDMGVPSHIRRIASDIGLQGFT